MIKNPKKYREESEKERAEFLRNLTYEESARMMEDLLSSELIQAMPFSPRQIPVSLAKLIKKN